MRYVFINVEQAEICLILHYLLLRLLTLLHIIEVNYDGLLFLCQRVQCVCDLFGASVCSIAHACVYN